MTGLALFMQTFGISPDVAFNIVMFIIAAVSGVVLFFIIVVLVSLTKAETTKATVSKPKMVFTSYRTY